LSFRTGAAEHLPIETASVDVVMCHMLLHHVLSPKQVLREMRRVVRPGGYLIIVDAYHHRHVWTLTEVGDVLCGIDHRRLQHDLDAFGIRTLHLSDAGLTHLGETVGRKTTFPNFLLLGRAIEKSVGGTTDPSREMHTEAPAC
ncbi:MAG TPA: methyltransferase domain-containing protein, partial [Ktedonobacteraceae bacterium]|nr:methyltransferase domain-containing protein [Ktedonobacteraceae bacterium]